PTGVSPYAETAGAEELVSLGADEVRGGGGVAAGSAGDSYGVSFSGSSSLENTYVVDGVNTAGSTVGMTNSPDTSSLPPAISSGLRGTVNDKKTGEKLAGVTVIATKKGSKESQTAITDERGEFTIPVAAGSYDLTYFYGDASIERKGVNVAHNQMTPVFQKLDGSSAGGETIMISGRAPMIDQSTMSTGVTITQDYVRNIPVPGRTFTNALGSAPGSQGDGGSYKAPPPIKQGDAKLAGIVKKVLAGKKDVVIETHGLSTAEVQKRAEAVKNKLVDDGIPATRIHLVPKIGPNENLSLRVLAVAPTGKPETSGAPPTASAHAAMPDTPVGESHFMADRPMNVRAGTSAMVAMVHGETSGGVVYLYDPISDRGDERFAFKAVRLDNPTDDTLEPGPVTVYGDGRFIGEGITEPVPPKASVVVPFALDRQILISRNNSESDRIAKLVTVQRGIITAEVQHRRQARFTITSRLTKPTKVYLRHRLETGWALLEAPSKQMKVGDSQLFEVDLGAGETKYVTIAEATPIERSLQLGSAEALDMMKVFIDEPDASPELKKQINALLETHKAAADLEDKIRTLRDQLGEYRARAGELHAQVVTLKLVKTGGELMTSLKSRLAETSEHMQKTTLAIVDTQEKLMLARLKFGNQLSDLHLSDAIAKN
ncbi:MAG TPA: carboxypeptidase regulatory-like domain-containing protein, partial [Kofleriaceae bacterium]